MGSLHAALVFSYGTPTGLCISLYDYISKEREQSRVRCIIKLINNEIDNVRHGLTTYLAAPKICEITPHRYNFLANIFHGPVGGGARSQCLSGPQLHVNMILNIFR